MCETGTSATDMRRGPISDAIHSLGDANFKEKHPQLTSNREFIYGGIASFVNVTLIFPFHKTVSFQQLHGITWYEAVSRLHHDGVWRIYRGVLPPLLQRAASGAVMFGTQGKTERWLQKTYFPKEYPPVISTCIAAIVAGCCEATLMPLERIQSLLLNKKHYLSYRNSFHAANSVLRAHGVLELYRGLIPVILRNCIGNTLYFCGHKWLSDIRVHKAKESTLEQGLWNFVFGGLLGGLIGVFVFPLNVAKTRMQSEVGGQFVNLRLTFLGIINKPSNRVDIGLLFRGLPANFVRSIISWGFITMTYQMLLSLDF